LNESPLLRERVRVRVYSVLSKIKERLRNRRSYARLARLKQAAVDLKLRVRPGPPAPREDSLVRSWCAQLWRSTAVLCDGTVVCACRDTLASMPLGNVERDTFENIWNGEPYRRLRRRVLHNPMGVYLCRNCVFRREVVNSEIDYANRSEIAERMPEILWIEPTVLCNLRCPGCGLGLIAASRKRRTMPFETYKSVLDQLGPGLRLLFFYDYGESFLHPRAVEMLRYARSVNETMLIHCSTNGIPLRDERKQREVIETGVDELLFSVDGGSQEVYERYRVGGDFEAVLSVMESMVRLRDSLGLRRPRIMWRYILFRWNDSDEEMDRARQLAKDIGVGDFSWLLTTHPPEICSRRFALGSPELQKIEHELFRWQDPTIDPMYGT